MKNKDLDQKQTDLVPYVPSSEISTVAAAAAVKAETEAAYVVARANPRNQTQARSVILQAVENKAFADAAIYKKPIGSKKISGRWVKSYIEGLSIRFAEEAGRAWGNLRIANKVTHDDPDKRLVAVGVIDLQTNIAYMDEITIEKVIERKQIKDGEEALGKRINSVGEVVYQRRTTSDELNIKQNALISKSIRNLILRIIPADIKADAIAVAMEVREKDASENIVAKRKQIADAFSKMGIMPADIEKYLRHPIDITTAQEIVDLRSVYQTIKDGESTWADYLEQVAEADKTRGDITVAFKEKKKESPTPAKKTATPKKTEPQPAPETPPGQEDAKKSPPAEQPELPREPETERDAKVTQIIEGVGNIGGAAWECIRVELGMAKVEKDWTPEQIDSAIKRINEAADKQ